MKVLCPVSTQINGLLNLSGDSFLISVDNGLEGLYVDGTAIDISNLPNKDNWQQSDTVIIPEGSTVIAVDAKDVGGKAGFLASSSGGVLTNSNWRCSNTAPQGWYVSLCKTVQSILSAYSQSISFISCTTEIILIRYVPFSL